MTRPSVEFDHAGTAYRIRLSNNALIRLQKVLGYTSDAELLTALSDVARDAIALQSMGLPNAGRVVPRTAGKTSARELTRAILYVGLQPASFIRVEDAGDFVDEIGYLKAVGLALQALTMSFSDPTADVKPEQEGAATPPPPFAGAPS